MLTEWRNWCRLCAKHNTIDNDVFIKLESISEFSLTVQKYFFITLPYDSTSTVCQDCHIFVSKIEKYAERCAKVGKMYTELIYDKSVLNDNDVQNIRYRYGIDNEEKMSWETLDNKLIEKNTISMDKSTSTDDLINSTNVKEEIHDVGSSRKRRGRPKRSDKTDDIAFVSVRSQSLNRDVKTEQQDEKSDSECEYYEDVGNNSDSHDEENNVNLHDDEDHSGLPETLEGLVEVNVDSDDDKPLLTRRDKTNEKKNFYNWDCHVCNENYKTFYGLSKHCKKEHDCNPEVHCICGKILGSRASLQWHKRMHTNENAYICKLCKKAFNRRQPYEQHMASKHTKPADLPYVCSKCPKRFATEKKVKVHESVHLPDSMKMIHPCSYCDKKFSKSVNVRAHIRAIHIGEKPFICEECGKSFGTKGALKEHQITHSDERPYQCSYCPKKFKNIPRLKTHEDIHKDTVYVCPNCGLQLNTKRTLKMHMVVHSEQKKYKCHYCGNEYKRSKALKNHLILHSGLRPYHCPFCEKTFANGSNCRSHKKKAHPLELAAMEASGEQPKIALIPKLEQLQPKSQIQHQTNDLQQLQQMQHQHHSPPNGMQQQLQQQQLHQLTTQLNIPVSPNALQQQQTLQPIELMQVPIELHLHNTNQILHTNNL